MMAWLDPDTYWDHQFFNLSIYRILACHIRHPHPAEAAGLPFYPYTPGNQRGNAEFFHRGTQCDCVVHRATPWFN